MTYLSKNVCQHQKNHINKIQQTYLPYTAYLSKDAAIELYLSSLEEKLMKVEIPKVKFNNLTNSERKTSYYLKNDKSIVIKSADKGSAVAVWDRKDYIKEAEKQLSDEEVYKKVSSDASPLLKTINGFIAKVRKRSDLKKDNLDYFIMKDPKFTRFIISYLKLIKGYIMPHVDR